PEEVRPFEILPAVRDATERQLFQGFVAEGMRRDGSVDLSKKGNSLRFAFQDQRGRGAQPAREGGTLPLRTFCGRQSVVVLADGLVAREDQPEVPCRHPEPRELPLPTTCRLQDAWKIAKQQGLRVSKPAVVEYYRSK